MKHLTDSGIACGIHYPIPVHLQEAYQSLGYEEGAFPFAERAAREFISLPMFPELTFEQVGMVIEAVTEAVTQGGAERSLARAPEVCSHHDSPAC